MLIVGGSCVRTCALVDIYKLNTASWRLEKVLKFFLQVVVCFTRKNEEKLIKGL